MIGTSEAMQEVVDRVVARTDAIEEAKMSKEDEVLPPMTVEELDAFLTAEDERLKGVAYGGEPES